MRTAICLLLFISLYSCSLPLELDAGTRLVLKTTVTNYQGAPEKDAIVEILGSDAGLFSTISNVKAKENGVVNVAFMAPANENAFLALHFRKEGFLSTKLVGFTRADFHDYELDLQAQRMLSPGDTVVFTVDPQATGNKTIDDIYLNVPVVDDFGFDSDQTIFTLGKNQDFVLHYTISDGATSQKFEVPLSIGEEAMNYTVTF